MASFMLDRRHKPEVCAHKPGYGRANLEAPYADPKAGRIFVSTGYPAFIVAP